MLLKSQEEDHLRDLSTRTGVPMDRVRAAIDLWKEGGLPDPEVVLDQISGGAVSGTPAQSSRILRRLPGRVFVSGCRRLRRLFRAVVHRTWSRVVGVFQSERQSTQTAKGGRR